VTFALQIFSILLGVGSLAWAYEAQGLAAPARWLMFFGLAWLFAAWRRWTWFAGLGLFVLIAAAGLGLWIGLPFGWMIAGTLGGLFAWDLADFARRLRQAAPGDDRRGMEGRHLARITLVALAGLGAASIAMAVKLQFTFEWAFMLAAVTAMALLQLINWLRNRGA
jgi:hypothetical protein